MQIIENKIPPSDMRARIQTIPTGEGEGVELHLEGGSYQFSSRKQKTIYDFPGEVRTPPPPPPPLSPPILEFQTVWIHIYFISKSIDKPSANYIGWRQRQRRHDSF